MDASGWWTALAAAFRFQLAQSLTKVTDLLPLAMAPLYTVIFLAITTHADREDLAGYAVLAPALIVLWQTSLLIAGEIIDNDRSFATLEAIVAAPTPLAVVILGRVLATVTIGLAAFAESWVVAALLFGVVVPVPHPGVFAATLVVTAFAMAGTATLMAGVFVLARSARTFQNSLSYPFYVLGGVLVPVALLPGWLQPFSRLVFLSWSADLLRDAFAPDPVTGLALRLAAVVVLGLIGFALAWWALARILARVRSSGTLTYT